ncbi:transposase [Microvirga sp. VF16]|nr:transposase [Microvirga sp. VF16]
MGVGLVLDGEVEIDGKYTGGHVRPENKAEDRVDRRLKQNRSPDRLCALAIRQRGFLGQTFTRVIRLQEEAFLLQALGMFQSACGYSD